MLVVGPLLGTSFAAHLVPAQVFSLAGLDDDSLQVAWNVAPQKISGTKYSGGCPWCKLVGMLRKGAWQQLCGTGDRVPAE